MACLDSTLPLWPASGLITDIASTITGKFIILISHPPPPPPPPPSSDLTPQGYVHHLTSCHWHKQAGSPPEVLSAQWMHDSGFHWQVRLRVTSGLSGWANHWIFLFPQCRPPCHTKNRFITHQWGKTTSDQSLPKQHQRAFLDFPPSPAPPIEGDYKCSLSTIQTKAAQRQQPQHSGQERIDCKSHHCAQVEMSRAQRLFVLHVISHKNQEPGVAASFDYH